MRTLRGRRESVASDPSRHFTTINFRSAKKFIHFDGHPWTALIAGGAGAPPTSIGN
jgi:hypothetical protein